MKFIREHIKLARKLRRNIVRKDNNLTFKAGETKYLHQIENLHISLFRQPLVPWLVWIYRFCAKELVSVVVDENDKVVGYDLFMFEPSEIKDNIIHEVYVGVSSEYQDRGIGLKLRQYSIECYDEGRLSGISTLAAFDNIKALRTAQRAGFAITKTSAKPVAHYLFRYLSRHFED